MAYMEHCQTLREQMVNLRPILLLVVLIHLNKKHHFSGLDKKNGLSKRGVPQMEAPEHRWLKMENPMKMDDEWGYLQVSCLNGVDPSQNLRSKSIHPPGYRSAVQRCVRHLSRPGEIWGRRKNICEKNHEKLRKKDLLLI